MADELFIIDVDETKGTASIRDFRAETASMVRDLGRAATSLERMETQLDEVARSGQKAKGSTGDLRQSIIAVDAAFNLASRSAGFLQKSFNLFAKPVRIAIDAQSGVNAIRTLTDKIGPELEAQLRALPAQIGQTTQQTLRSAYDALSAGINEENLVGTLRQAGDLARAGQADLTDTLSLLRVSLKSYEQAGLDATTASDVLFATVRKGVTTIPDLAASFGNVVGVAGQYGASFQETTAAVAELTKIAPTTAEAVTQLSALFKAFAAPSAKAQKTLKGLGVEYGIGAIKAKGLTGILDDLQRATGGNVEILGTLFQRQEATRAVLTLLANDQKGYKDALEATTNAAGETARATGIMADGAAGAFKRFQALKEQVLIDLGEKVLPTVLEGMEGISAYLQKSGPELALQIRELAQGVLSLGRFVAQYGDVTLAFFATLAGGAIIGSTVNLGTKIAGLGKKVAGLAKNGTGAAGSILRLSGAVTGLGLALPVLIPIARQVGNELGFILTQSDRVEQRFLEIANRINKINLEVKLGDFKSVDDLENRRAEIQAGDQVVIRTDLINETTGIITRAAAEGTQSIAELLERGLDDANAVVQGNLAQLARLATEQAQLGDERLAELAARSAELAALNKKIDEINSLDGQLRLFQAENLQRATVRRDKITDELLKLEDQAAKAKRKAVELELTRANLSAKFQAEASKRLEGALRRLASASPTLSGLARVGSDLVRNRRGPELEVKAPTVRIPRVEQNPFEGQGEALVRSLVNALKRAESIQDSNDRNRLGAIADQSQRELALLELRFDQELRTAERAGLDLLLVEDRQAREKADRETQAAQQATDKRRELAQEQARFITDQTAQRLVLLDLEREATLDRLAAQGASTLEAARYFENERTRVLQDGTAARIQAMQAEASAVGSLANNLIGIGDLMNGAAAKQTGAGILLRAIALGSEAFSAQAEAIIQFGRGNIAQGAALQAGALLGFARAAQLESRGKALGASGGAGFSGSGGSAGGVGSDQGPSRGSQAPAATSSGGGEGYVFNITNNGPVVGEGGFGQLASRLAGSIRQRIDGQNGFIGEADR